MKKLFLLFFIIFFASFVSATICCENGCFPSTENGYNLKCCINAADPNKGTAYLGCLGSDLNSYCLNDMWGDCLQCQYISNSYQWVDVNATKCGACKICNRTYDSQARPVSSACIFDTNKTLNIQYACILGEVGLEKCLVPGQLQEKSGAYYCCGLNTVTGEYETGAVNSDNNFFTDFDTNQKYNGVYEKRVDERFVDKNSNNKYDLLEEVIDAGDTPNIQTPDKTPLTLPVPDICDIEITQADCTDGIDNDGDGKCDRTGCGSMPADPDCTSKNCVNCVYCWESKCEGGYYKTSTGTGSCFFDGVFGPFCYDDSDDDSIHDSKPDNCWKTPNGPAKGTCIDDNNKGTGINCNNNGDCAGYKYCSKNQEDTDNDGMGDACDNCSNVAGIGLSANEKILCTGEKEITCSESNKCELVDIGEEFFCNGTGWINRNLCTKCFFSEGLEYYWVDNYDKICNLSASNLINTDKSDTVCELLKLETTEGSCDDGETGCWDSYSAPYVDSNSRTQCCGDDWDNDIWIDSKKEACYKGVFHTDADYVPDLCELVSSEIQGECDAYKEIGCWSSSVIPPPDNKQCCGDDEDEVWVYSTDDKIDDILVPEGCYKGKWFIRTNVKLTYYEIFT